MRGLITDGKGNIQLVNDIPLPKISDYTAIVKTLACGICNGTDTKLVDGHLHGHDTYPAILGHESVGEIVELGKRVRNLHCGDRILRTKVIDTGNYASLYGGFTEYGLAFDYKAMVEDGVPVDQDLISQQIVPPTIDPAEAVMLITLKEVCSAWHRLGFYAGARVAVAGDGPVGIALGHLAKLMGASFVAICGHHTDRLERAAKWGADLIANTRCANFEEELKKRCDSLDFFVDGVGRCELISQGLALIKNEGVIGLYGIGIETNKSVRWYAGPYNWKLQAVQFPIATLEAEVHDQVLDYVQSGKLILQDYVTHVYPVEEYKTAFDMVLARKGMKVVLSF